MLDNFVGGAASIEHQGRHFDLSFLTYEWDGESPEVTDWELEVFNETITNYEQSLPVIAAAIADYYPKEWEITSDMVVRGLGDCGIDLDRHSTITPIRLIYLHADFDDHIIEVHCGDNLTDIREVLLEG